jgi:hypothetical protein
MRFIKLILIWLIAFNSANAITTSPPDVCITTLLADIKINPKLKQVIDNNPKNGIYAYAIVKKHANELIKNDELLDKLAKDFADPNLGLGLRVYLEGNAGGIKAWVRISEAAKRANPALPNPGKILRTDLPSLNALSKFDDALISRIGQQRFDNFLKSLIEANPKCASCGGLGERLVGNLSDVLDDFHVVVTQRVVKSDGTLVTGFDDFMAEAGEQASKAKGAVLSLRKMARN